MKKWLLFVAMASCHILSAQTNVRAWYAQGQVWIVWQTGLPFPETFAVYKKNTTFTNVSQANVIGRLYQYEYLPGTYIEQTQSPGFTYKIPRPDGTTYTLGPGEGLFVETPTNSGSAYYAVVEWGNTAVNAGVNITANAVSYTYDPVNEPVSCHLQLTQTLPSGHKTKWYSLWAMGRQDPEAGRPDFPVMANAFKNGMPSMFIVSEALGMDTTGGKKVPMTHWFHGGGMVASQFLANDFEVFGIEPLKGISVSHNDDFAVKTIKDGDTVFTAGRSLWFGWAAAYNPFNPGFDAGPGDTVINYTQRRILWINDWLTAQYHIDPAHIALQGYSMGSAGASALGKAYPEKFSTVCAFNNGYRSGVDETSERIVGSIAENLPTNLRRGPGDIVRINEVFDLTTRTSPSRDFPLFRTWAGKNDPNDRMHWGADLVAQYRKADSLGLGTQISWDERFHVYDSLNVYWIEDRLPALRTYRGTLAYQEGFSSNQSYPAFFNHRLDSLNNDPGVGTFGTNNGDGDNWGTWGGWHNWGLDDAIDSGMYWEVTAWLTSDAVFPHDNSPYDQLVADMAIRKPQYFRPAAGQNNIYWNVRDLNTGLFLQSGIASAQDEDLVVIPQIVVYKESIRKVRIRLRDIFVAVDPDLEADKRMYVVPNPSAGAAALTVQMLRGEACQLQVTATDGRSHTLDLRLQEGYNTVSLKDLEGLPAGVYYLTLRTESQQMRTAWIKY